MENTKTFGPGELAHTALGFAKIAKEILVEGSTSGGSSSKST